MEQPLLEPDPLGLGQQPLVEAVEPARRGRVSASRSMSSTATPGTSVGYCITRCRPAAARSHVGIASTSTPSSVTLPASTS